MPRITPLVRSLSLVVACLPVLLASLSEAQAGTHVVISQVYGGGGNTGAKYTNDYVELFNPTASALTLTGYSVQYASAAGAFSSSLLTALPATVTLQPGEFYLVGESAGAGGTTPLPVPDVSGTINMSATAGKIALVSSTTVLSSACPTTEPSLVDFVGFGGTANCSLGAPAPAPSNTTADLRTNVCVNAGNNGSDFSVGAPNPRTSATALAPCSTSGSAAIKATGMATPATAYTGSPVLLTVQVTPGTVPASTGITVQADLSSIGGSSTQMFFDDGVTGGDVTAGDNIFSYSATVASMGSYTLPVKVMDQQLRATTATIALTTQTPPPTVSIRTIQANKPSSYATQTLTTSGIVVGVKSNGFYLEAKNADTTPVTPEGILVYTGSTAKPAFIALGAEVQVTGTVNTYPSTSLTPDTEIDGPQTFTLLSTGNALPTPVVITATNDSPSGGIYQFAKYEGMRVAIGSLTTTSGTGGSLTETTETNVSTGQFYGVVTRIPRPFREPGIGLTDTLFGTVPAGIPRWDSNPELLLIDSLAFGGPALDVTSNATLTGISGVMDFSNGGPDILLDAATRPVVTGLMTAQAVPVAAANEFTVASFNMERFYNDVADADNPGSSAVTVTTAAYQRRLAKASLAVRNVLLMPDIVGAQEIENMAVLADLANRISADAVAAGQTDPVYQPYVFLANDGTAINTGMLVKSTRVNTISVQQLGLTTTFTNSVGSQAILNDRTPLVLHAGIKRAGGADYPVTVISVHQRSLINVDDPTTTGQTVRLKREKQAEYLAMLIQGYQAAGEHVISVGDYNAFEFSDGFVDSLGVTTGSPVPASQVVTPPVGGLVNPALVDLVTLLPAAQRQSYVEVGSAQVLDHVVVTSDLVPTETRLVYAHMDSDFPLIYLNDATRPERVSDHDPAVAYFTIPALAPVAGTVALVAQPVLTKLSGGGYQVVLTVTNNGTGTAVGVQLTAASLGSATAGALPQVLGNVAPGGGTATVTVMFPASAGVSGAGVVERLSGTYNGGTFGAGVRAVLP